MKIIYLSYLKYYINFIKIFAAYLNLIYSWDLIKIFINFHGIK